MSTDAIVMLKNDHKEIRRIFRDFEDAGENAHATIWMMPEGRVPATAAATMATPTSNARETNSRRAVEALGSIIL